jgi:hypothetical protein
MDGADYELIAQQVEQIAQQVAGLSETLAALDRRVADVEKVNARLEAAALTTSRALEEVSRHWDAVYEAMRRAEEGDEAAEALRSQQYGARER